MLHVPLSASAVFTKILYGHHTVYNMRKIYTTRVHVVITATSNTTCMCSQFNSLNLPLFILPYLLIFLLCVFFFPFCRFKNIMQLNAI